MSPPTRIPARHTAIQLAGLRPAKLRPSRFTKQQLSTLGYDLHVAPTSRVEDFPIPFFVLQHLFTLLQSLSILLGSPRAMGVGEKVGSARDVPGNELSDVRIGRVLHPVCRVPTNHFPDGRIRGTAIPPVSEPGGEGIGRFPGTCFHDYLFVRISVTSEPRVRKVGASDPRVTPCAPAPVPAEQVQLGMEQTLPVRDDPEVAIRDSVSSSKASGRVAFPAMPTMARTSTRLCSCFAASANTRKCSPQVTHAVAMSTHV